MAISNVDKYGKAKKKGQTQGGTASAVTATSATVPKPSLREIPQVNEKPSAEIDTGAAATKAASGGGSYSYAAEPASTGGAAFSAAYEAAPQRAAVEFSAPAEDAEARLRYESALGQLEALQAQAPVYTSRYDAQIRDLYEQITGRGAFRYDSATDPLYQQYRQGYIQQGQMAMRDTMGQAAALTGGYGSSYAQSVGQQQYDAYLRRLADILPETYGMALNAWQAEGDALRGKFDTAASLEKSDYERYLDELAQHNRAVSLARDDAETAYERMIYGDETAYSRAADDYARRVSADKTDYARQQDAYTRLLSLMAAGYAPSAEEYAAAGLSSAQGEALRAQLAPSEATPVYRVVREKAEGSSSKLSGAKKRSGDLKKNVKKR